MARPIKKVGPFTQVTRSRVEPSDMWRGLGHDWYRGPGTMQHHGLVEDRERMGQKKTPKDDVRNIKRSR